MTDTRKLELRSTEDDKVWATITLQGDHVVIEGLPAARSIMDSYTRAVGGSEVDAFDYLWRAGWSNGPVALVPVGRENDEPG